MKELQSCDVGVAGLGKLQKGVVSDVRVRMVEKAEVIEQLLGAIGGKGGQAANVLDHGGRLYRIAAKRIDLTVVNVAEDEEFCRRFGIDGNVAADCHRLLIGERRIIFQNRFDLEIGRAARAVGEDPRVVQ